MVVETPEENIDWAMVPQQALQGVALFRSAVVGPCKPIHLGQLIDVEADGVWAPAVVTGLEYEGEGKVQARLYGPPLGPHITVPVAHTRKHSGPFVASTDLSGGTEPVPIPCVNEVDAACPHEEDFEYSRVCVPLVAAPPPDVPCACVCGPGTG
ncbi:MAG: hypothetical protein P4L40_09725, partial [Terracidiphilus sp.]|nr:hypothetical protein [Terracidiphilus sp.]